MRFTSVFVAGILAVVAHGQSTAGTTATTKSAASNTSGAAPEEASMMACLNACADGDVNCRSHCIAVNATNECVAACPQGNGTASDIAQYQKCTSDCIGKYYYTTQGGTPQPTSGAGAGAGSGSGSGSSGGGSGGGSSNNNSTSGGGGGGSNSGATTTEGAGVSATGTSKPTTVPSSAADALRVAAGSAVGALGFMAALLAL
ncbi:hypothetical protein B0T26DRAFT_634490 [Lasiosphaeria miniovina]|uniref:Uncharacterized protein n=1 Tax=Lasiosphaeria miniovina TaxID=1954250 RepID=A0AA40BHE2_9PEZI|nr:uncharacterized protein B0T26DRAFT_634490 [Lasiosphaeria miniovina]KAK0734278.1 hypothetical protein B0T26DRAFT_634490 [Lasiosphaeria miniovina]